MKEHLQVLSDLGDIIESANLVSQNSENKNRKDNNIWNYYLNGLNINGKDYLLEFDVLSRNDGENHYRVRRLELLDKKRLTSLPETLINQHNSGLAEKSISTNDTTIESVKKSIVIEILIY